jgi:hypothetical protein
MAISPAAISASIEVRQYGLLLFFVCGSLYATERALAERSSFWAIVQGLFLLAALLTHYTAVVVIAALGIFVLVQGLFGGVPRRVFVTFALSQIALATVLCWLYFARIRHSIWLRPGALDYLQSNYFSKTSETAYGFAWRSISKTFLYAVGGHRAASLAILVFLAGIAAILMARTKSGRAMAILVVAPFVLGFVCGAYRIFPFAGSRHQTYIIPFIAAGLSAALAWVPRRLAVPLLLLGAIFAPFRVATALPDNNGTIMPKAEMTKAIDYIVQTVPRGTTIFVDEGTRFVLTYYLGRNDASLVASPAGQGFQEWLGGYRVVSPRKDVWSFRGDEVLKQVSDASRTLGVPQGDSLWVVSAAFWGDPSLASRLPAEKDVDVTEFGRISVIKMRSGNYN